MPIRPTAVRKPLHGARNVPTLSWNALNLYNLWLRTTPGTEVFDQTKFNQGTKTLFQQRWLSKRLTKGYHAEHINAKMFERWFLPATLPRVRSPTAGGTGVVASELSKWVEGRERAGGRTRYAKDAAAAEKEASAPVGTLMFTETERRIDTLVFRSCFASSISQARAFVIGGHVKINGRSVRNANTLLNPGDIFSVNPKMVPFLKAPTGTTAAPAEVKEEAAETAEAESTEAAEATAEATEATEAESAEAAAEASAEEQAAAAEAALDAERKAANADRKAAAASGPFSDSVAGTHFTLPDYASPHLFVPAYILPSFLTCSAVYVRHPTARPGYSEIPSPYDAGGTINSLTWEWYQRVAPRMRPNRRARLMNPQRDQDRH